jgi:hypothetical protein
MRGRVHGLLGIGCGELVAGTDGRKGLAARGEEGLLE